MADGCSDENRVDGARDAAAFGRGGTEPAGPTSSSGARPRSRPTRTSMFVACAALGAALSAVSCYRCEKHDPDGTHYYIRRFRIDGDEECPPGFVVSPEKRALRAAAPGDTTRVSFVATRNESGLRSKFVSVQARPKRQDADLVTLLPFTLGPGFDVSETTGIFRDKLAGPVEGGFFGIEVFGADTKTESYALYAALASNPDGMVLTAVTHDGIVGSERRIDGIDQVDLRIREAGGTVYFEFRTATFWSPLASTPLVGAGPLMLANAVYDIDAKGEVGFTNLDVAALGTVSGKRAASTPKQIAADELSEGMRHVLRALSTLNRDDPSTIVATAASFQFRDAADAFAAGRDALAGLAGRDAERARGALDKLWKLCARTGVELTVDPAAVVVPRVLRTVPDASRKQFTATVDAMSKI